MPDYRIRIQTAEPVTLGAKPVVSNEIGTLECIPATSLRGALAAELAYAGRRADLGKWFSTGGPQWTPAFPTPSPDQPVSLVVPMPLCFVYEKGDLPFKGKFAVCNTLLLDKLPKTASEYGSRIGVCPEKEDRFQWVAVRSRWLLVQNGSPAGVHPVEAEASMHVGLHYGRQTNRASALFSRREIVRGTRFLAWVHDPGGVLEDRPESILLGKRRSAGNGSASVEWQPGEFPWQGRPTSPDQAEVNLQLVSDAVVPDRKTGGWLRGLDAGAWSEILGVDVVVKAAACSHRVLRGWSDTWGVARGHTAVISAGSAFRLAASNPGDLAQFHRALGRLASTGLGSGRHEGYGWVAVNPAWLDPPFVLPQPHEPDAQLSPEADPWPGFAAGEREMLRGYLNAARKLAGTDSVRDKIGALAAYAARTEDPADVVKYLKALADRPNDRGWKAAGESLRPKLESLTDIRVLRFLLEATETYCSKEDGNARTR